MSYNYSLETVRGIILGTIEYRKCPICEGCGYTCWDENGEDEKPGNTRERGGDFGECDNCNALGFILREKD